jgi:hypothetical protein
MTNTHENLEHAEHVQHAAHDPFSSRVAMTMAIIAAVLAAVTMLSHQAHNNSLNYKNEAAIKHTQASDRWNEYQANNIRDHEYRALMPVVEAMAKEPGKESVGREARDDWAKKVEGYKTKLPELKQGAEKLQEQAETWQAASHQAHDRGRWLDLSELAVELGLVLCSLAVLMRRAWFWYSGIGAGVVGVLICAAAFVAVPVKAPEHAPEGAGAQHPSGPERSGGH